MVAVNSSDARVNVTFQLNVRGRVRIRISLEKNVIAAVNHRWEQGFVIFVARKLILKPIGTALIEI